MIRFLILLTVILCGSTVSAQYYELPAPQPGYKWVAVVENGKTIYEAQEIAYENHRPHIVQNVVHGAANVVSGVANAVADARYNIAYQSALYRAQHGIKGHSQVDLRCGRANGVGWSSSNPNPQTCFWGQRNQGAYAVVRGRDGWYATLVL